LSNKYVYVLRNVAVVYLWVDSRQLPVGEVTEKADLSILTFSVRNKTDDQRILMIPQIMQL